MGSKSSICDDLIPIFPKAENFYDLFGGGFSVTHAMLVRRKSHFNNFYFNEIRPGICELIQNAINGKFNYDNFKPEWISSSEFHKRKDSNAYIKLIWSFGNNGRNYSFSKEIEPLKRSLHNAVVFNDFDDYARAVFGCDKFRESTIYQRRLYTRTLFSNLKRTSQSHAHQLERLRQLQQLQQLQQLRQLRQLQQLERLEQLQQLERLQQLEQLERLHFSSLSYDRVEIKQNSIIYCDPPYQGTGKYDNEFDHRKFLDWAHHQENPVFISEYKINDKRFRPIFKINKVQRLYQTSRIVKNEMVYANKAALDFLVKRIRKTKIENGDHIEKAKTN